MEKEVDGITYELVPIDKKNPEYTHRDTCFGCVGFTDDDLCKSLTGCCFPENDSINVWEVKK